MSAQMTLKILSNRLSALFTIQSAAEWDNVGLLVGDQSRLVHRMFLTNDLTSKALQDAINKSNNEHCLILTYHPIIFRSIKSIITESDWQKEIMLKCIQNNLSIYSPHTALDSMYGGVNDWLASMFKEAKMDFTLEPLERQEITGLMDTSIAMAQKQRFSFLMSNHWMGNGRLVSLKSPIEVSRIVQLIKNFLKLNHLRVTSNHVEDPKVRSIAICPGSGGSLLKHVPSNSMFLTGEMGHHQLLDAIHRDIIVVLTEHSNCERGYLLDVLLGALKTLFPELEIDILNDGDDPIRII
ncbi:hypothetical protein ACOME3_001850 [Neoechinorhynchus agilis]